MTNTTPIAPDEDFRQAVGFAGLYEISSYGRVWSVPRFVRGRHYGNKIIKLRTDTYGYRQFETKASGKSRQIKVHRLVCEAFHGPAPAGRGLVAHRNGDPSDNRADNLYWATPQENAHDRIRHGRGPRPGDSPHSVFNWEQVREIRRVFVSGSREFGTRALGRRYGASAETIRLIVNGKMWKEGADESVSRQGKDSCALPITLVHQHAPHSDKATLSDGAENCPSTRKTEKFREHLQ
jgi:hypothetical protein